MNAISVRIVRWVSSDFPGWVECILIDSSGRQFEFRGKAPVYSEMAIDPETKFPQQGLIACEIVREWKAPDGRDLCLVNTGRPWGLESREGWMEFEVFRHQIQPPHSSRA